MPLVQEFFELRDPPPFDGRSWIPLRKVEKTAFEPTEAGIVSIEGWNGVASAAVPQVNRATADTIGWNNGLGIGPHWTGVEHWGYCAADVFHARGQPIGINLVIDQYIEQDNWPFWYLHPDLVVALGLLQEDDTWFRPEEGWVEVARLKRDQSGHPSLLEIKSEFLRDYLAARGMALYCSSFRERVAVSANKPAYSWKDDRLDECSGRDCRECVIADAEYPFPPGHFLIRGALWRTEWVEAGDLSMRVRGDPDPHATSFALTNDGTRANVAQLARATTWLYFKSSIATALLRHRSAKLWWATGETGSLGATAYGVHFGINQLGLITVLAKDIGSLKPWEQRIWSAYNVTPEGGVSKELFDAQMMVNPAETVAPEIHLDAALGELDAAFARCYGEPLLREHDAVPVLLQRSNRFVAAEPDGVLELAKNLTRVFIERVNVDAIIAALGLSKKDKKPGSLKALEKLVAHHLSDAEAAAMMAPLFGIYDLRLAGAHLGSNKIASGLSRAGVDDELPTVVQGRQMLQSFVDTVHSLAAVLPR